MAGAVLVSSIQMDIKPEMQSWIGRAYKDYPAEYERIFTTVSTNRAIERFAKITGMSTATPYSENEDVTFDSIHEFGSKELTHTKYGIGIIFTEEHLEDLKSGLGMEQKARGIVRAHMKAKELVAAAKIDGLHTADSSNIDGKAVCASDHPLYGGGTVSNTISTPADLSSQSIIDMVRQCMDIVDDRGLSLNVQGQKLIYAKDNHVKVPELLKTEGMPYSPDNTINVLRSENLVPGGGILNHYLEDQDATYLLTDAVDASDGLVHYVKKPLTLSSADVFESDNQKFKGVSKWSFHHRDFLCVFGNPGA